MSRLILKDNTRYEKDLNSGAIVNRDLKTYNALRQKRKLQKEKDNEIAQIKNDVKNLTSLVEKLIQKIDK